MIKVKHWYIQTDPSTQFEFLESRCRLSVTGTFNVFRKLKNGKFAVCSKHQHKKALRSILIGSVSHAKKIINEY